MPRTGCRRRARPPRARARAHIQVATPPISDMGARQIGQKNQNQNQSFQFNWNAQSILGTAAIFTDLGTAARAASAIYDLCFFETAVISGVSGDPADFSLNRVPCAVFSLTASSIVVLYILDIYNECICLY